jgi:hypothetical protein
MKCTTVPTVLVLGLVYSCSTFAEMYICQSKSSENIVTSRPDLYQNCKTLKGGTPYTPQHKSPSFSIDQTGLTGLSKSIASANSESSRSETLTVFDRAAIFCAQLTQRNARPKKDCGLEQAEGIGFINDLLADTTISKQHYTNVKVAIRACLDMHSYGEAVDYKGTKKCIESFATPK